MRPGMHSIRLPPPFEEQDARVPPPSTTALLAQRIAWMPRLRTSKIMTWGMQSLASKGLLAGIWQSLWRLRSRSAFLPDQL